ncbi:hypothetical protein Mapa_009270 [Marchantia paleacea]|nr:hypothetical protein Mapa_009270 [Marchantia paleacea]
MSGQFCHYQISPLLPSLKEKDIVAERNRTNRWSARRPGHAHEVETTFWKRMSDRRLCSETDPDRRIVTTHLSMVNDIGVEWVGKLSYHAACSAQLYNCGNMASSKPAQQSENRMSDQCTFVRSRFIHSWFSWARFVSSQRRAIFSKGLR